MKKSWNMISTDQQHALIFGKLTFLLLLIKNMQKKEASCRNGWEYCFCGDRFCYEVFIKKISRIHGKLVWQGWYGNACLLCHYEGNPNKIHYKKRTYLTFIGKAKQVQGTVMAICQSVLKQIKEDFPHLESIIDKSDNAGCYHNEVLFALKFHWPRSNLNLKFLNSLQWKAVR